jgi:hypothetical protein
MKGLKLLQAVAGTVMVGIASGIYLIANLGPGPRDGLMTGFQRVTGLPIAWVRAMLEIIVISIGWVTWWIDWFGNSYFCIWYWSSSFIWALLHFSNLKE